MNINYCLILGMLATGCYGSFGYAMEQEFKREKIEVQEEMVRILPKDAQEAIELPVRLANLSQTLQNLMEDIGEDEPIPLNDVSLTVWQGIYAQLERVYALQEGDESSKQLSEYERDQLREQLIKDLREMWSGDWVEMLKAVNYLNIQMLLDIMINKVPLQQSYAGRADMSQNHMTTEQLNGLPLDLFKVFIVRLAIAHLGYFNAPEIAWQVVDDRGPLIAVGDSLFVTGGTSLSGMGTGNAEDELEGANDLNPAIWNLKQGKPIAYCIGHQSGVGSLSVEGDTLVTCCGEAEDPTIRVWNLPTGTPIEPCIGDEDQEGQFFTEVCLAGNKIVSRNNSDIMSIWDLATRKLIAECEGKAECAPCVVGDEIVSVVGHTSVSTYGGTHMSQLLGVWDFTGKCIAKFDSGKRFVTKICAAGDKTFVYDFDHGIVIWDLTKGKQAGTIQNGLELKLSCVKDNMIIAHDSNFICVYDLATQLLVARCDAQGPISSSCLVGNTIVALQSRVLRCWDISMLFRLRAVNGKQAAALCDYLKSRDDDVILELWADKIVAGWKKAVTWQGIAQILSSSKGHQDTL